MRHVRTAAAVGAGVVLLLTGCSSSTSKPAAGPAAAPATTSVASSATTPAAPATTSRASTTATTPQPAPSTTSAATTTAAPSTSSTCNLPDRGDIIEWSRAPGIPDSAVELGGTDPEHCTWTFDTLKVSSPDGAGYCTKAAWASDNVGYDPNATPAPPLKKVQVAIGDCG